ncbi:MAG: NADPH-dependent FMN reductase [Ferruginibacter sp.]
MEKDKINILAISGSLRNSSSNSSIIRQIKTMMPENVNYKIYDGLGNIPPFDDADAIPAPVTGWRNEIEAADAVLFCSPEYAFGVPGTLKNALDWSVGSVAFSFKPVALITASSGGEKAHAALQLILTALGTKLADSLLIPFVRTKLNDRGELSDTVTMLAVQSLVTKLILAITGNNFPLPDEQ